ncbi:hypothetical protein ACLQUA_004531 [Enterobacter ludwigii]|uniref:hypothetical protein n=1 Tax=Enterobacter TaxID=547 RepID=UPI000643931C|nr:MULTISPECIES: hypothetical protein [Enterobacter]KAA0510026.1 hypothetical protein F0325_23105 [Enterobacter ludwigii]KLP39628.1 hypothetical protein ABR36_10460 [Enterobacter ludwigii]KZP61549.1 hypothetical protein A3N37_07775 [Enterobacter ludwigii]MBA7770382.1 hypothetical protein [Enterobacter sp. RHBSTW-00974]MBA7829663.1 hypothetical protein [Enterobacter sp. RHBSTW-00340]
MEFLKLYGKEIFSVAAALLTWTLNTYFKARVRLAYGELHNFTFLVPEPLRNPEGEVIRPQQLVHTRSVTLLNEGREVANKIEVIFNYQPRYLNIWPVRKFTEFKETDGRYIIEFESLAPKDSVMFEALSINGDLPDILAIRSKESIAREINLVHYRDFSPLVKRLLAFLLLLGFTSAVYLALLLLQWLLVTAG